MHLFNREGVISLPERTKSGESLNQKFLVDRAKLVSTCFLMEIIHWSMKTWSKTCSDYSVAKKRIIFNWAIYRSNCRNPAENNYVKILKRRVWGNSIAI